MERNENLRATHRDKEKPALGTRSIRNPNYKSILLPLFLVMASACTLGPWQCLPGPIFRPRNFNIKIGPGDEANLEVDEPHEDGITIQFLL